VLSSGNTKLRHKEIPTSCSGAIRLYTKLKDLKHRPPDRCVDQVNQIVDIFNRGLSSLVNQLNTDHPGSMFLYGNTGDVLFDMLKNPTKYGE
jgi:hypothetical protein